MTRRRAGSGIGQGAAALVLALGLGGARPAVAGDRSVELVPFIGYEGGGTFHLFTDVEGPDADVDAGMTYGLGCNIRLGPGYLLELLYARQETSLTESRFIFDASPKLFDLSVEHFQGGLMWEFGEEPVRPFIEGLIGASRFAPDDDGFSDEWFFSGSIGGGVKLYLSEHFGLQFKARYIPILIHSDEHVFCDPHGCFTAFDQETLSRGEASAGLLFRF